MLAPLSFGSSRPCICCRGRCKTPGPPGRSCASSAWLSLRRASSRRYLHRGAQKALSQSSPRCEPRLSCCCCWLLLVLLLSGGRFVLLCHQRCCFDFVLVLALLIAGLAGLSGSLHAGTSMATLASLVRRSCSCTHLPAVWNPIARLPAGTVPSWGTNASSMPNLFYLGVDQCGLTGAVPSPACAAGSPVSPSFFGVVLC